jgi:hypothetical protein
MKLLMPKSETLIRIGLFYTVFSSVVRCCEKPVKVFTKPGISIYSFLPGLFTKATFSLGNNWVPD